MIESYLSLPSVEFSDRESLPSAAGVYFVGTDRGALIYIGRSVNLHQRLKGHEKLYVFMRLIQRGIPLKIYYRKTSDYVAAEAEYIETFRPLMNREMKIPVRNRTLFKEQSLQIRKLQKRIRELKEENEALKNRCASLDELDREKEKTSALEDVGSLLHFSTISSLFNPALYNVVDYCPEEILGVARLLDGFCIIGGDMISAPDVPTGSLIAINQSVASLQQKIKRSLKDRLKQPSAHPVSALPDQPNPNP